MQFDVISCHLGMSQGFTWNPRSMDHIVSGVVPLYVLLQLGRFGHNDRFKCSSMGEPPKCVP